MTNEKDDSGVHTSKPKATDEQIIYANLLDWGMKAGLAALVVTFSIYVFGLLPPHIPLDQVSLYWGMGTHEFLQKAAVEPGWAWTSKLGNGDFLNYVGIAFLAGITILCYLPLIPMFLKKKDVVYALIAIVEVLVLALAASGILHVGGH
ncbi:MAG: hypothetical protein HQL33_10750 [Alphaproteobacteria bacterium]|nr:hypothetical protein [Alphaproteobacteria bacterium]MBF0130459.1 hypothetical protein [Alphaproteobacteria bacterium]